LRACFLSFDVTASLDAACTRHVSSIERALSFFAPDRVIVGAQWLGEIEAQTRSHFTTHRSPGSINSPQASTDLL
jgi:hypothetical protein